MTVKPKPHLFTGVGTLAILLIILKMTGTLEWSWLWITAPGWLYFFFAIQLAVIAHVNKRIQKLRTPIKWDGEKMSGC